MNRKSGALDGSDRQGILALLGGHRILRHLAGGDLERLLGFAQLRTLRRRETLFTTGESGAAVYAVLGGYVKLSRTGPGGRDIVLELAGPGRVFGELAAINGWPRAADAVALSDARLLAMDGRHFVEALRRNPDAMLEIVRMLSERLTNTTAQMEDVLFLPIPARLARALTRLAALHSQPTPAGLQIDIALSQRELGEMTGLARESINKQLAAWRDAGIVRLEGSHLTLTDAAALQEIGERLEE